MTSALEHAARLFDQQAEAQRFAVDPVVWVQGRLDQVVWSKQADIMRAVRDNRRTAIRSGHGVGKSHVASLLACWWLDTHKAGEAFVVTTAPTYSQVRAILWRYIRRHHKAAGLPGRVNQTEWLIDDELVAIGRKPADHDEAAFQGIHAGACWSSSTRRAAYPSSCGSPVTR
jgi:hypothetical protein